MKSSIFLGFRLIMVGIWALYHAVDSLDIAYMHSGYIPMMVNFVALSLAGVTIIDGIKMIERKI